MIQPRIHLNLLLLLFLCVTGFAKTERYRIMWREDPATSMVIGWDQISGSSPTVYLDEQDHGRNFSSYRFSKGVDQVYQQRGMNNHFVRLRGLKPDTRYFFVIKDSDGISERMSFRTAPNHPNAKLSIIAGGDSRNHRDVRRDANAIVAKLRPHCVLFSGDMIRLDNDIEWIEWFDDWQETITPDGHLTPILVAQGNHEKNGTLAYLFDIPNPGGYYALNLGGNLLRIYTLNTEIPAGDNQRYWLRRDLNAQNQQIWKIAQYHRAMRPHTSEKTPNLDAYSEWADLFFDHGVRLVIESDAHLAKTTWPVKPSTEEGHEDGFIRDDAYGTVFTGEGGWGAPLREADNPRAWTRSHSQTKFNQFKWLIVSKSLIQMRTIRITTPDMIQALTDNNRFDVPKGLAIWHPPTGDVVNIYPNGISDPEFAEPVEDEFVVMSPPDLEMTDFSAVRVGQNIEVNFTTRHEPAGMKFEVQRSLDGGKSFETISSLPGKGSGKGEHSYRSVDLNTSPNAVQGRVSYRLRRVFGNGESDFYYPNKSISEDVGNWDRLPKLVPQAGQLKIAYELKKHSNVRIRLIDPQRQEKMSLDLPDQPAGRYLKTLDMRAIPRGRYLIVVRANNSPLKRYRVVVN